MSDCSTSQDLSFVVHPSRFKYVVTPSNYRKEWTAEIVSRLKSSEAPFHYVSKQIVKGCSYVCFVRTHFKSIRQKLLEQSENGFGVTVV